MPSTVRRSSGKAQRTWSKAHDAAVDQYGEGERAHRTAFAALKHEFEKRGDRWSAKDGKGPSDPQAAKSTPASRRRGKTHGGVDVAGNTKQELYERARKLDVPGRSSMSKSQLADAVARRQRSR
jgi:cation transport regulator ChaB